MISAGDFRNGVTFEMDGQVVSIIEFQWVSYQVWLNQAKINEVQDRLVGWNPKEKRDHNDSRRELYFLSTK